MLPGLPGASTSRETAPRAEEKEKESLFGGDSATFMPEPWGPSCHSKAWPSHPFSGAHDACHGTGSISPVVFPRSDPPQKLRCPRGRVRPPRGSAGGRPAEQGRPMHRQASGAEARHPAGQNTQAQRARLCWSILFQSCRLLSSRFSVSSLNITKKGQRPALLGPSWGQSHGPGHAGLPASGNGLLGALRPGGHTSWSTSCLWGGVDSTPEGQREGATIRLTSREKQNTQGAGQGRRGVSLKERKKEGEVFTLKNREEESQ